MQPIQVHSTKYDGSLHYRYAMSIVRTEPDLLVSYMTPGVPVESYRGAMITNRYSLSLYWNDRPYNLTVNWSNEWRPISHYINVASPADWSDGTLRFIDLDLDVIWRHDNTVILDDEDEFELHRERFGYPPELVAESWRSREEVRSLISRRVYPFDGSLYMWRPNGTTDR
jgi:protein associated with RNAse G/E